MNELDTPLGAPQSGRARYAAAMALYQAGRLSAEALEVYRICALNDHRDPAPLLADRGLSAPAPQPHTAESALRGLVSAADAYFATLPGPGVAEVRTALNQWRDGPVTATPRPNAVLAEHLPAALDQLAPTHPDLAAAITHAAPHLTWITYDKYPRDQIGEGFATGHAYASIIGEDASIPARDFDLGIFLIAPHVLYRDHHHAAPELYAPMTGPHGWRFGPDQPLILKPAHHPVWNDPFQHHMTKVGPTPFLALFGWTRDVLEPARVIPAQDWPALEALRLEA